MRLQSLAASIVVGTGSMSLNIAITCVAQLTLFTQISTYMKFPPVATILSCVNNFACVY